MDEDEVDEALERFTEMVNSFYGKLRREHPQETSQQVMDRARDVIEADPALRRQMLADLNLLADAGIAARLPLH